MASTAGVKQRLNTHRKMVEEYDNIRQELKIAIEKYGSLQGVSYDAMPKGSGGKSGNGKIENAVIRKINLEELLKRQGDRIESDWAELEPLVMELKPTEALIIRLRYKYATAWDEICRQLYGKKSDYAEEQGTYMNRIFNAHGRALLALAKLYT